MVEDNYYQHTRNINRNNKSKHYDLFLYDTDEQQERLNNDKFLVVFNILKEKFQVIYKLFGEESFELISHEYFLINPAHLATKDNYGKSFPEFLDSIEQLQNYSYVKWLARLDWFWFSRENSLESFHLPKGTLNSWASIYKGLDSIDIFIDESVMEKLEIKLNGNQYSIVSS